MVTPAELGAAIERHAAARYKAQRVGYAAAKVWAAHLGAQASYALALRFACRAGDIDAAAKLVEPARPRVALR